MQTALDLTGTPEQIATVLALVQRQGEVVEASEPSNLDASRALNAGIDIATISAALTFITLVFTTGTAALEFLKAAREEIKAHASPTPLVVSDPASGKALGTVAASTSDAELLQLTGPAKDKAP